MANALLHAILILVKFILTLLLIPAAIFAFICMVWGLCCIVQLIKSYRRGYKIVRLHRHVVRQHSFWRKLFVDAPAMIIYDLCHRDPNQFGYSGMVLFTGRQGYGKTIACTHMIRQIQREYPGAKCITNYAYEFEDDQLTDWQKLMTYKNGRSGVIVGMDEVQNWFSSKMSMNFPPGMLEVITQNRKNARIICGTSQNFSSVAKDIRKQCTEVRECITLFHCITIVHRKVAELNAEGDVEKWHSRGWYWFVHDVELRDCYDTYKVIETLAKSGFKQRAELPE